MRKLEMIRICLVEVEIVLGENRADEEKVLGEVRENRADEEKVLG